MMSVRVFSTFSLLLAMLVSPAWGQTITRGPYLQQSTDSSVIVHWRTDIATDSVVRFGTDSAALVQSRTEPAVTTEHTVRLTGLSALTRYFYSVGDSAATIAGDASYHFHTAPVAGNAANTRVWVIGDSGTANADARAVRDAYKAWTSSRPADFMLMLGDNAYTDGTDAQYQSAVFDTYPVILRQTPLWPTLGNHDGHSADSGTQSGPYYEIFDLPTAAEAGGLASGTEAYYAFDYGNIHFVVLDSYDSDRSPGGNMLQWLEGDLALNDKPWLIAFFHHPPYTKGSHDSDTEGRLIDMRQYALPVLEAWGVDLVMTGHSHSYERSYLLDGHYGDSSTLDTVANVLDLGDGGKSGDGAYQKPDLVAAQHEGAVYAVAGSSGKVTNAALNHPAMFLSLASLGSLVLDISGNNLDVTFLDQNASIKDQFSIVKTPDSDPPLIVSALAEDASHVRVDFSERVDAAGATNAANYAIGGLSVSAAELLAGNTEVRLATSVMSAGSSYVLTVNNVMDESGNAIAADSQVGFTFNPLMNKAFQDGLAPDSGYAGTRDTYIREASATTNYGTAASLQVDGDEPSGSGTDMSILLAWDISEIPADATVQSVTLTLNTINISNGPYFCYALLRAWDEGQASWNQAASGSAWSSAGALGATDRDSLPLCTISAPVLAPLSVDLNTDGIAAVQAWVDGSLANNGLVISDSVTSDGADFDSSDSASAINRPKLEIVYSVPVTPPNNPPTALFSENCVDLACDFSDGSADTDGTLVGWSWDFGDGAGSTAQNPTHSYADAGTYAVRLTVTDNDGGTANTTRNVTVTAPPLFVDYVADGQIAVAGTVTGSFTDTPTDNGVSQSIRERTSGGKKQNRYSFLEHKWTFSVAPAAGFVLNLNAWSSGSTDGDSFVFAYSTDNGTYTDLVTISSADPANSQMALLPGNLNGTVYIRVRDSDRTAGHTALDSVFVDQLYIRAESALGPPPAAPTDIAATPLSSSAIALDWTDNSSDELGFEIQRSTDQNSWTGLGDPGMDATSVIDSGLQESTLYYYRIRAFNASGNSDWSATASATTDAGPPPADITLTLSGSKSRGKHVIDLTWSGTTKTNVDIFRDGDPPVTVTDTGSYTDNTGNRGGRTYTYQVCEAGTSTCSAVESVTF